MAKLKRKAEASRAPRDLAEAETFLARLGEIERDRALAQAALDETVAKAQEGAGIKLAPLNAEADELTRGLQLWAEANRAKLTNEGRTKTVRLASGEIAWRTRPPSVRLSKVEMVIEAIKRLGKVQFLRTKEEVNKEAMLAEPDVARTIAGVTIASEGEDFVVTPAGAAAIAEQAVA